MHSYREVGVFIEMVGVFTGKAGVIPKKVGVSTGYQEVETCLGRCRC